MPFVYSDGTGHPPTQSKFVTFAAIAFEGYFAALGVLISATAALFPHKHLGEVMDMPGSLPGMPVCVRSLDPPGPFGFSMGGMKSNAAVVPKACEGSKTPQAWYVPILIAASHLVADHMLLKFPRSIISMVQATKAIPLPEDNSNIVQNGHSESPGASDHRDVAEYISTSGNDCADDTRSMKPDPGDPTSLAIDTIAIALAPLLQAKLIQTSEKTDKFVAPNQTYMPKTNAPVFHSGERDRQTAYGRLVESIKMPALKPLRLKLEASASKLRGRKSMSALRMKNLGNMPTSGSGVKDAPVPMMLRNDPDALYLPGAATSSEDISANVSTPQPQFRSDFNQSGTLQACFVDVSEDIGHPIEAVGCVSPVGDIHPADTDIGNPASLAMGPVVIQVNSLLRTTFLKTTEELIRYAIRILVVSQTKLT